MNSHEPGSIGGDEAVVTVEALLRDRIEQTGLPYRLQPCRTLRVLWSHFVFETIGMGYESCCHLYWFAIFV